MWDVEASPHPAGQTNVHHLLHVLSDVPEYSLQRLWDLESIGISSESEPEGCVDQILTEFNKTVQFVEGRYVVALPWKKNADQLNLLNNRKLAEGRLESLDKN